jgi:hypothetical protein
VDDGQAKSLESEDDEDEEDDDCSVRILELEDEQYVEEILM